MLREKPKQEQVPLQMATQWPTAPFKSVKHRLENNNKSNVKNCRKSQIYSRHGDVREGKKAVVIPVASPERFLGPAKCVDEFPQLCQRLQRWCGRKGYKLRTAFRPFISTCRRTCNRCWCTLGKPWQPPCSTVDYLLRRCINPLATAQGFQFSVVCIRHGVAHVLKWQVMGQTPDNPHSLVPRVKDVS